MLLIYYLQRCGAVVVEFVLDPGSKRKISSVAEEENKGL